MNTSSAFNGTVDPMEAIRRLEATMESMKINSDDAFLVSSAMIIFFMQTGFAFLEAGAVRSKNTTNILLKNLLDTFIGGLSYWLIGYGIAYGTGSPFIGLNKFGTTGLLPDEYARWFFQFVFAATSATIISGSVAERCSFFGYFAYAVLLSGFVYPACAHWAWSEDGWLHVTEFHDFAGSSIVHVTGGSAALIACIILGPRIGRVDPETGKLKAIRGHSVPLAALGGFILLFGFLAFNGASQGSISSPGDGAKVSLAVTNTILSGCSAGLATLLLHRLGIFAAKGEKTHWSFLVTLNGALTGMVSICAGCNVYATWAAVIVGCGAAVVFLASKRATELTTVIDDPLDAAAVHLGGGAWGMIACGLLSKDGLMAGNPKILAWNAAGTLAIAVWSFVLTGLLCGIMKYTHLLRIGEEEEIKGLDVAKHEEPAYPVESWLEDQYIKHDSILPLGGASVSSLNDVERRAANETGKTNGHQEPQFIDSKFF